MNAGFAGSAGFLEGSYDTGSIGAWDTLAGIKGKYGVGPLTRLRDGSSSFYLRKG